MIATLKGERNFVAVRSSEAKGVYEGEPLVEVKGVAWQVSDTLSSLLAQLKDDPEGVSSILESAGQAVQRGLESAKAAGATGVFYRLYGAEPNLTTPMEYGGHFLELERAMVDQARQIGTVVVAVEPSDEPYIDFLTDLPADILAWEGGPTVEFIRPLASCALGHDSADADYYFTFATKEAQTA